MRRKALGRDLQLQIRIGITLALLAATIVAAGLGFVWLFRLRPGWWPLWTAIVVLLVVGIGASYGAGRAKLLQDFDAQLVRPSAEPALVEVV